MAALFVVPLAVVALVVFTWLIVARSVRTPRVAEGGAPLRPVSIPAHAWKQLAATDVHLPADFVIATNTIVLPQSTTINDTAVVAFDRVSEALGGVMSDDDEQVSCAWFSIAAHCPLTVVTARYGGGESAPAPVEGTHAVRLESEDFNRTYRVDTHDEHFVHALFDDTMIDWFLADLRLHEVVIAGTEVLLTFSTGAMPTSSPEPEATDPEFALAFVAGFLDRMPPGVIAEFGVHASP